MAYFRLRRNHLFVVIFSFALLCYWLSLNSNNATRGRKDAEHLRRVYVDHFNATFIRQLTLSVEERLRNASLADLQVEIDHDLAYLNDEYKVSVELLDTFVRTHQEHKLVGKEKRVPLFKRDKKLIILEYTKVFSRPKFCSKSNEAIFNSALETCAYSNCAYTCDKSAATLRAADALIFHQRDLENELFRAPYHGSTSAWLAATKQLPFTQVAHKLANNADQVWIMWNDEATPVKAAFNDLSPLFNWTMSYKTNAEVYEGAYGFVTPAAAAKAHISPAAITSTKLAVLHEHFARRQNAALWFVSNCAAVKRIQQVLELSRFYPVHIYGRCDPLQALGMSESQAASEYPYLRLRTDVVVDGGGGGGGGGDLVAAAVVAAAPKRCAAGSECEARLFASFKYFLAFENTNCTDYITEKLWRTLGKSMIPVLMQPDVASYRRMRLPAAAFIHVGSETLGGDMKRVGAYLRRVDADFDAYFSHVKWPHVYVNVSYDGRLLEPHRMCSLCKRLNEETSAISYTRLADFFNSQCTTNTL